MGKDAEAVTVEPPWAMEIIEVTRSRMSEMCSAISLESSAAGSGFVDEGAM